MYPRLIGKLQTQDPAEAMRANCDAICQTIGAGAGLLFTISIERLRACRIPVIPGSISAV